jgi:hypothetical protein
MRWPNLFVVGAPKAATTSLHAYLDRHPEVAMAPDKEPFFFDEALDEVDGPDQRREREQAYLDRFAAADDERYLGEASPFYLVHPQAPARIHERVPGARIVASLRDPVERAFSHYLMEHREGRIDEPFPAAVERELAGEELDRAASTRLVAPGRYADGLERYLDAFGEDQVFVLLVDDLGEDPHGLLGELAGFLDLDPAPLVEADLDRHYAYRAPRGEWARRLRNAEPVRRVARTLLPERAREFLGDRVLLGDADKPEVPEATRRRLAETYADDVARLEALLDRRLPELRASWPDDLRPDA